MSRPTIDVTTATDESDYEIHVEADRDAAFQLRNGVFAGYFDGQYPSGYGEELRDAIPSPAENEVVTVFGLSADEAIGIAQSLEYGAVVAENDDRSATARRMNRHADKLRAVARDVLGFDRS